MIGDLDDDHPGPAALNPHLGTHPDHPDPSPGICPRDLFLGNPALAASHPTDRTVLYLWTYLSSEILRC